MPYTPSQYPHHATARSAAAGLRYVAAAALAVLFLAGGAYLGMQYSRNGNASLLGNLSAAVSDAFGGGRTAVFEIAPRGEDSASSLGAGVGESPSTTSALPLAECSFASTTEISRDRVVLSEVAWMGGAAKAQNEWFELANSATDTADISGWQMMNGNERVRITFPAGTTVPAQGYALYERSDGAVPDTPADGLFTGSLRNTNEGLRLYDADCNLVDEVLAEPSWPAGDNASKRTMERNLADFSWYTSAAPGGTPRRANSKPPVFASVITTTTRATSTRSASSTGATSSLASTSFTTGTEPSVAVADEPPTVSSVEPPLCAQDSLPAPTYAVLINEVAWAGTGSLKTSDEWVELKNPSPTAPRSLSGWQLINKARTLQVVFGEADMLAPGGYFLLERTDDTAVPTVPADKFFTGAIKNNDESLRLFDGNCRLVDEVIADAAWPGGTASPDYRTAERTPDLSWHSYAYMPGSAIFGTPRALNSEPTPQPPSYIASGGSGGGTSTPPSPPAPPPAQSTSSVARVLISEVMAGSDGVSANEFVELYNAGETTADLTGWTVKKRSSTGSESTLVASSRLDGRSIGAHGYLLLANDGGYTGNVPADILWPNSYTLAYTQNVVVLYDAGAAKIDESVWAEIPAGKSYVRGSWDTAAFTVSDTPTPQGSGS